MLFYTMKHVIAGIPLLWTALSQDLEDYDRI